MRRALAGLVAALERLDPHHHLAAAARSRPRREARVRLDELEWAARLVWVEAELVGEGEGEGAG